MNKKRVSIFARSLLTLITTLGVLIVVQLSPSLAQSPEVFVSDRLEGFNVYNNTVYWFESCGDDFSAPTSYLKSKPSGDPGGTPGRTLYAPASCQGNRVSSANVAVDGTRVYWIGGDGHVLSLPLTATPSTAPTAIAQLTHSIGGFPSCCSLAVDSTYVYWQDATLIARAPKSGGAPLTLTTGTGFHNLSITSDGKLFVQSGTTLMMYSPSGSIYVGQTVATNVTAYYIDSTSVYYATMSGTHFTVLSESLSLTAPHTYLDGVTTLTVYNLLADSNYLYWYAKGPAPAAGRIYRFPKVGVPNPESISADLLIGTQLGTDGHYLFWTDYNNAIYRLPVGAAVVAPPSGNISLTGLEITQGIQVPGNLIPLVGNKTTVVRAYVQSREDTNGPWTNVGATLQVSGSTVVHSSPRITVSPTGSNHSTFTDSFYFVLSPEETAPGTRTLTVNVVPPSGRAEPDTSNNSLSATVTFGPARYLTVQGWTYANTNNGVVPPGFDHAGQRCVDVGSAPDGVFRPASDFELNRQWVENVYPVSQMYLNIVAGSGTQSFDNSDCSGYLLA
ncbi:MAG TPA: hypothetical protein VKQ72_18340, partial [Aggregatilineales bacterium]|nr:hypothetical protein [Aggregatilineales bacterium]